MTVAVKRGVSPVCSINVFGLTVTIGRGAVTIISAKSVAVILPTVYFAVMRNDGGVGLLALTMPETDTSTIVLSGVSHTSVPPAGLTEAASGNV